MLPVEINAYVTMHWELDEYKGFNALKRFVLKFVRVLKNIKRTARPVHLIDGYHNVGEPSEDCSSQREEYDDNVE